MSLFLQISLVVLVGMTSLQSQQIFTSLDGINGQQVISNVNGIDGQDAITGPNEIFVINEVNEGRVFSSSSSRSCDSAFLGGFAIGRLLAPMAMADGTMMTTAQAMISLITGSPMTPMMCQPTSTPCPQQTITTPCPPPPPKRTAVCPPGWIIFKELCYKFSENDKNWDDAKSECGKENAILAEPDTTTEIDFLKNLAGIPDSGCRKNYWIGGKDPNPPSKDFLWTSRGVKVKIELLIGKWVNRMTFKAYLKTAWKCVQILIINGTTVPVTAQTGIYAKKVQLLFRIKVKETGRVQY